jgi:N-formylglutamate deformylase
MPVMKSFFISIPHSGERVPDEAPWLSGLPEPVLMRDVDRFVDQLYKPVIDLLGLPWVFTQWHRYAVDLNRLPDDVDASSVEGHPTPAGQFSQGLHWVKTTQGETLISTPMDLKTHELLIAKYFQPFHEGMAKLFQEFKSEGFRRVFHLDAHSMPSRGTQAHRDPGMERDEIVVSDFLGKSCSEPFKDLVISAYKQAGFKVGYNFPYIGGRVTQTYGHPSKGQESIQVELNRRLYMDEDTKQLKKADAEQVKKQLTLAVEFIHDHIDGDQIKW